MSLQNVAKDFAYAMGAAGSADPAHTPASVVAPAVMNDLTNITNSHLHKRKRSENTTKKRPNNTKASFRMEAVSWAIQSPHASNCLTFPIESHARQDQQLSTIKDVEERTGSALHAITRGECTDE